ncbi:MAG: hypothetical protein ABI693_06680 [Bryobacteraceae bacterium]
MDVPFDDALPFFPLDFFEDDDLLAAALPLEDPLPVAFLELVLFEEVVFEVLAAGRE